MIVWPDSSSVRTRKRRVFLRQPAQRDAHLLLVGLGLGLHRLGDHRLREHHALEQDHVVGIAERLARRDFLQAHAGGDVAGAHFLDFRALVGVHLQQAPDAVFLALDRVVDGVAGIQHARIHPDERELADVRVGHQLERERGELLAVVGLAEGLGFAVVHSLDRRDVDRRRQVVDHRVEHRLHALVLERGAAQHRHDLARDRALAQAVLEVLEREVTLLEVLVHQVLVGFGGRLEHLLAPLLAGVEELGRNLRQLELHSLGRVVPDDRLHADQVDHAGERVLGTDRHLDRHRVGAQTRAHLIVDLEEIGADPIHLVDEGEARHGVLVGLAPDRLGLRLHAAHRAVDHARAVEHPHRALDLDREVDVPRGVDDVDVVLGIGHVHALPETGRRGRRDGDAALLLLLHPVHGGSAVVDLAKLVIDAGVEQDALGGRRLAGVDVRRDADVSIALDGGLASHGSMLQYCRPDLVNP